MTCRFEDLLRALTVSRTDICNAMVFALDNAESATEVCFQLYKVEDSPMSTAAVREGLRCDRSKVA